MPTTWHRGDRSARLRHRRRPRPAPTLDAADHVPFRPADQIEGTRVLVRHRWPRGFLGIVLAAGLGGLVTRARSRRARAAVSLHRARLRQGHGGQPRKGVGLEVIRQKTGFAYVGETDASGLYVIVTRLADENRSDLLLVRAGPASLMIAARFEPADHNTERGTQVDFTGSRVTERPELFAATLKRFLGDR